MSSFCMRGDAVIVKRRGKRHGDDVAVLDEIMSLEIQFPSGLIARRLFGGMLRLNFDAASQGYVMCLIVVLSGRKCV